MRRIVKTMSQLISGLLAVPIVMANMLTPMQAIIFLGVCFGVEEMLW